MLQVATLLMIANIGIANAQWTDNTDYINYTHDSRHISINNKSNEPAKLYVSGLNYNNGLQIGRDDAKHKIILSGNVGIGLGDFTPATSLDVVSTNYLISKFKRNSTGGGAMVQIENGSGNWEIGVGSTGAFAINQSTASFGDQFFIDSNGKVGIGTSQPGAELSVNGQILAKEIKVVTDISVPDYVFGKGYRLRPLHEVESFINENNHLPDMPPAYELNEQGINVVDMEMKLLKKVEELTLYLIQQDKQNTKLTRRIEKLEEENAKLKKSLR